MTDDASTIPTDVQFDDDDGANAFLSSFTDDKKRPSGSDEGAPETQDETPANTEDTDGEADKGTEQSDDPDDQEVEIKVGEETKKATLRDLKRLYGQEAALTQKSQKASEQLRLAEENIARTTATSKAILERAQKAYEPYANLDWLVLAQTMDTEQFQALRQDAAAFKANVDFLTTEVDGFMKDQQTKAATAYQAAAGECIKVLSDPTTGIEGFGKPLYDEMMAFCGEMGLPTARQSTNAAEYKIVHMAMQWAKSQKAAKEAESKAKKAVDQQKRVVKPGSNANNKSDSNNRAALARLRQTGDVEDAAAAFLTTLR